VIEQQEPHSPAAPEAAGYLLDTNACVAVIRGRPPHVQLRLNVAGQAGLTVAVPSIVVFELWYGVLKSDLRDENRERLEAFLKTPMQIITFDERDSVAAAEIRAILARAGTLIGPYDVLIAGQAMHRGLTLVTANVREFSRVAGLKWEDWFEAA